MRKLAADAGWAAIGLIALALRFALRFAGRRLGGYRRAGVRKAQIGGYNDRGARPPDPKRPALPDVPRGRYPR